MGAWTRLRSAPSRRGQGRGGRPGLVAPAPRRCFRPHPAPAVVTSWTPAAAPWRPVAERRAEWTVKAVGRKGAREQPAERKGSHRETPGNSDQLSRNSAADLPPAPQRGSSRPPRPAPRPWPAAPSWWEEAGAARVGGTERGQGGWAERVPGKWAEPSAVQKSGRALAQPGIVRSEEHTSELQSLS